MAILRTSIAAPVILGALAILFGMGCGKGPSQEVPAAPEATAPPVQSAAPEPTVAAPAPALTSEAKIESSVFGTLSLAVPENTQVAVKDLGLGGQVEAALTVPGLNEVVLRVTLMGPDDLMPDFGGDPSLQEQLTTWWQSLGPTFAQTPPPIQPFDAGRVHGLTLTADDPSPAPDGYARAFRGLYVVDDGVFMVGALYRRADAAALTWLPAVVESARWAGKPRPVNESPTISPVSSEVGVAG